MDNKDYIRKWLEGTLTEEEREFFEKTEDFQSLQKLSASLLSFRAPDFDAQSELLRLTERKQLRSQDVAPEKRRKVIQMSPLLRLAAVLVVAAGIYLYSYFFTTQVELVETSYGREAMLLLPDSSEVILNAVSEISFDKRNWSSRRVVSLRGEAFFKVAKGSTFTVETSSGTVRVLGTVFNVKNRPSYFEVICYEGLVEVKHALGSRKLKPMHMFRVINGKLTSDTLVAPSNAPGWISNESSFNSVPFGEVIHEFERQYNVKVSVHNVDLDQLFTGRFVNTDMKLALEAITLPLNLTYKITDSENVVLARENR